MKRRIITNTDSGAGCLKTARIADKVTWFGHSLVSGRAPLTSEPAEFFCARAALLGPVLEDWEQAIDCTRIAQAWQDIAASSEQFDRIELWLDPECNAQFQCIQFLDYVRSVPDVLAKLVLVHADRGERTPEHIASLAPTFHKISDDRLDTATLAWRAYRRPTRQAWFALLDAHLSETVSRLLEELPGFDTGLGTTQLQLLTIVSGAEIGPRRVLVEHIAGDRS